jgi:hypothetical protein
MTLEIRSPIHGDSLADVLERILDKGIVIAGDISVSLVGIELLTIRLRLLIATVDKARELGIDWWEREPAFSSRAETTGEGAGIEERMTSLEHAVDRLARMQETPR